jgi:hypothetical protein
MSVGKLSRPSVSVGRGHPVREGDQQPITKGDLNMMISTNRDEDDARIEVATVRCDYCDAEVDADADEITEAGWSEWVGGLHVCPVCRERMAAYATR